jgi:nucleotide-binding universal stress UspA family protein
MILIAYDGSPDANAAIDHAAQLMPGAATTVLTVWEPMSELFAHPGVLGGPEPSPAPIGGLGMVDTFGDPKKIDEAREAAATATAMHGADRARAAGLDAHPRRESHGHDLPATILAVAAGLNADAVVMGTRGPSAAKSFLLGNVSQTVVHHADRPVLIVPVARARRATSELGRSSDGVGVIDRTVTR